MRKIAFSLALSAGLLLSSCGGATETPAEPAADSTAAESTTASPESAPEQPAAALAPGVHCFTFSDPVKDAELRLEVAKDMTVVGTEKGEIHDEAESYFAAYTRALKGKIDGQKLLLTAQVEVDGDSFEEELEWAIRDGKVIPNATTTFAPVACP